MNSKFVNWERTTNSFSLIINFVQLLRVKHFEALISRLEVRITVIPLLKYKYKEEFLLWLSALKTQHCLREDSIPGLAQWIKYPVLPQTVA